MENLDYSVLNKILDEDIVHIEQKFKKALHLTVQ